MRCWNGNHVVFIHRGVYLDDMDHQTNCKKMEIKLIHEHHVAVDLLPEHGNILDLGCRGFGFTNHMRNRWHRVVAVDMDDLKGHETEYEKCAITNYNGLCGIVKTRDPQATHIEHGDDVECWTLETFSKMHDVDYWDLIKMDIESAEKLVIPSIKKPMAKQISVEFHMHLPNYYESDVEKMVAHLESIGYKIATHEKTNQHGAGFNYWSSLFIHE